MADQPLIEVKEITELPTLALALGNYLVHCGADGVMGKATFTLLQQLIGGGGGGTGLTPEQVAKLNAALAPTTLSPVQSTGVWVGTQAQYDAIASKTATIIYLIKDS